MLDSWFDQPRAATKFLVGFCLFDFAALVIMNGGLPWGFFGPPLRLDAAIGAGAIALNLAELQPWRLLSAVFVHLSVLHLGMNLFALQSLGGGIEDKFGSARLVLVFGLCGIWGFVASRIWYGPVGPTTAGASGALFGMIGVEVGYLASRRDPHAKDVFVQNLIMGLALAFVMPVNNPAHLGGFVAGLVLGVIFDRTKPSRFRKRVERWGALLLLGSALLSVLFAFVTLFILRRAG